MSFGWRLNLILVLSLVPAGLFATEALDWETITLTTRTSGAEQIFSLDDDGNYSSSAPSASAGRITKSELENLDSQIDAIKEEAFQPLSCSSERQVIQSGNEVSLTFSNAENAIVYQYDGTDEVCRSGDPKSVDRLVDTLRELQSVYGCASEAVWSSSDQSFVLSLVNGIAPIPENPTCTDLSRTYDFNVATNTLSVFGCSLSGPTARTVQLTEDQASQVVLQLLALRTTCPLPRCTFDAPVSELTIRKEDSGLPARYHGEFYSGCANSPAPPFVPDRNLFALSGLLDGFAGLERYPG